MVYKNMEKQCHCMVSAELYQLYHTMLVMLWCYKKYSRGVQSTWWCYGAYAWLALSYAPTRPLPPLRSQLGENIRLHFFQSQFYTVYILWKSNPKIFFLSTFAKFTSYCSSHYNANPFCKGWFTSFIHIPFYTYSGLFQSFQK